MDAKEFDGKYHSRIMESIDDDEYIEADFDDGDRVETISGVAMLGWGDANELTRLRDIFGLIVECRHGEWNKSMALAIDHMHERVPK